VAFTVAPLAQPASLVRVCQLWGCKTGIQEHSGWVGPGLKTLFQETLVPRASKPVAFTVVPLARH
jgi:hypothetical protein